MANGGFVLGWSGASRFRIRSGDRVGRVVQFGLGFSASAAALSSLMTAFVGVPGYSSELT